MDNLINRVEKIEQLLGIVPSQIVPTISCFSTNVGWDIYSRSYRNDISQMPDLSRLSVWDQAEIKKFRPGKPPFAGWWETICGGSTIWRWWDGEVWSCPVNHWASLNAVADAASTKGPVHNPMWRWLYPHDARVRREIPQT